MSDIQAEFDRASAEHHRVVTTPLPDGWLEACMDAGFPGFPAGMTVEEVHRRIRAIVNTALPLHERMLREQIAAELDAASDARKPGRDFAGSSSEFHEAYGRVSGLREAARIVRGGTPTRVGER